MPTSVRSRVCAIDTSVAVPFVLEDHENHEGTVVHLSGRRLALAGHAAFETFSVLTRLPSPLRLTSSAALRLLAVDFPHRCFLGSTETETLFDQLPSLGISGGAVYDALVGAAAKAHGLRLATRDRRAVDVYRALGVDTELLTD